MSIKYKGTIYFRHELTGSQIACISAMCGEDVREHPDWFDELEMAIPEYLTYIDLKFTDGFDGLEWDGSEKSHDLAEALNLIVARMKHYIGKPIEFEDGEIRSWGPEAGDMSVIKVVNNVAKETIIEVVGREVKCPRCEEIFMIDVTVEE